MDPEPALVTSPSSSVEVTSSSSDQIDPSEPDPEEPLSFSGPSIALLGLVIAMATVGVPLAAVMTERPVGVPRIVPAASDKSRKGGAMPIAFVRASQVDMHSSNETRLHER